jgi:hypothetical protein
MTDGVHILFHFNIVPLLVVIHKDEKLSIILARRKYLVPRVVDTAD